MLVAKDDAFILDFEGEPGRSLAERRSKVAGGARRRRAHPLDRLFDHRGAVNAINLTPRGAQHPHAEARSLARQGDGRILDRLPRRPPTRRCGRPTPPQARNLLDFFLLEKAFYEMEYELMNRPAWLHVPLDGTWRILTRHNVVQS